MNTKNIIKAWGSTQGLCNPLRNLNGEEFATRDEAVEAIYTAMYDIIDSENGCEMIERPNMNDLNDEEYLEAVEKYVADCHDFIRVNGYAKEDSWRAIIEEIAD